MNCHGCYYFLDQSSYINKDGICRYDPPKVVTISKRGARDIRIGETMWPEVFFDDWCGKYEAAADKSLDETPPGR